MRILSFRNPVSAIALVSQFNKIPSLIQILAADWLAVMFVFPLGTSASHQP